MRTADVHVSLQQLQKDVVLRVLGDSHVVSKAGQGLKVERDHPDSGWILKNKNLLNS